MADVSPVAKPARPARVFFALWPAAPVAKRLYTLGGEAHALCDGRRMRRDTLHITLAFLGDVAQERLPALLAVGDRVGAEAFTLALDRLGGWRHNRIVWAGAHETPPALAALVGRLNGELAAAGFPVEQRSFAPHVTLLRNARAALPERSVDPIEWRVDGFALMASQRREDGAQYTPIRQWTASHGTGG
ncbi:RNA 2',3'-cyclic phosphodiesterase [Aromatoleum sp.]|uniref:RNA 2',3'-cyclic phosphodiesterase n=1 Tax=Aromatoleum sp. TaxID=2307007 RepID=UPI002FC7E920